MLRALCKDKVAEEEKRKEEANVKKNQISIRELDSKFVPLLFLLFSFLSEFQKIAIATAIGFGIMGFIGFFVKLIHIPINNIIVGS